MNVDDVEDITVLGAGAMGHGIAEIAAIAGYSVRLNDVSDDLLTEGIERIEWSLDKLVEHDQLSREDAEAAIGRIHPVVDLEGAVAGADIVIEAVPEKLEVKRDVYDTIDDAAPDRAIFASNTSSLSITTLADATERPDRFCGMHFFNPPVRMELVEVIAGEQTTEGTLAVTEALAESMGKTPVRVRKDSPGFIVNRIAAPLMNEAAWLVHEDEATIAAVDSAAKYGLGLPMGCFELLDFIGIDVAADVLEYLHEVLGAAYEPCPSIAAKVADGALGQKTGRGFYDYENGGVSIPPDEAQTRLETRLVAVMANEVAKLLDDGVADVESIDVAVRLGLRFPEGPARLADEVGLEALVDDLEAARAATGHPRYEPAPYLVELGRAGDGFREADEAAGTFEALAVDRTGPVGRIAIDRPHRMNTITPGLLAELVEAVEAFEADDGVRAVLITGAGDRAFSAGADVDAFAAGATPLEAVELARAGQRAFGRLESSDLPIIAGVDGFCLGGGMELAAACDLRLASERAEFGQPEHDLGLMPGWGGTQRLARLVGEGRAKEIIFTAQRYDPETLATYGFLVDVVPTDEFEERAMSLANDIAAGPPIAQRLTKRAIHAGRGDMPAGLEAEANAFGLLAASDDLLEGLSAFAEDREPEFSGE